MSAKKSTYSVVRSVMVRDGAVATIPSTPPTYHRETTVTAGGRGATYIVRTRDGAHDVYHAYMRRSRPMRSCPLRDAIISAVIAQAR